MGMSERRCDPALRSKVEMREVGYSRPSLGEGGGHDAGRGLPPGGEILWGIAVDVDVADAAITQDEEAGVTKASAVTALALIGDEGFIALFKDALNVEGDVRVHGPAVAKVGVAIDAIIQRAAEAEIFS